MKQILVFFSSLFLTLQVHSQSEEEQMVNFLKDTLRKDPGNSELLFMHGLLLFETKKYDSAIVYLTHALENIRSNKHNPVEGDRKPIDSLEIYALRAHCYEMINDNRSSITDYRYLQIQKPGDFFYSIAVARLYLKSKDFQNAQKEIDRLKKPAVNERGLVYQSILFFEQNQFAEALAAIDFTLQKYPGSVEGILTKAKILDKLNKTEEACKTINEANNQITLEYFGGQLGYMRDFTVEIENLKNRFCK